MPRPRGSRLQLPHPLPDVDHTQRLRFTNLLISSSRGNPILSASCVAWAFHKDRKGYGQVRMGRRVYWAHRISYALFVGPIPEGMTVNHKCRNPSCINPHHLELLTITENTILGNKHRTTPINLPV